MASPEPHPDQGDSLPPLEPDQGDSLPPLEPDQGDSLPSLEPDQGDALPPLEPDQGDPPPILDAAQVEALRDSMTAEDLAMLVDLVTAEIAERTVRLAAAVAPAPGGPQRADLARQAHQLLGCARSIGAERLADAAGRIEANAATAPAAALAEAVAALAALGEDARVAFAAMARGDAARSPG